MLLAELNDGCPQSPTTLQWPDEPEPRRYHCPHEIGSSGYSGGLGAGAVGSRTVTYRCCWCGATARVDYVLGADPEHGPFGPKKWVRVVPTEPVPPDVVAGA